MQNERRYIYKCKPNIVLSYNDYRELRLEF